MIVFIVLLGFAIVFEIIGDVFLKNWTVNDRVVNLVLGMVTYTIGTAFWAVSLRYESLSKAVSVVTIANLLAVVLIGVIFFKEQLTVINWVGIVLGIISMVLIEV